MKWLSRNFALLIGGLVFLPLIFYALIMWLSIGCVFYIGQPQYVDLVTLMLISYVLVYFVTVWVAIRRYRSLGDYGYFDLIPIFYFSLGFLLLFFGGSD